MTEVDRDVALTLLKRLRQRELITEAVYAAACNSHFFDSKNFTDYSEHANSNQVGKDAQNNGY